MDKALAIIIFSAIILLIAVLTYAIRYVDFIEDYKYLTMEIKRAESGSRAQKHWRRQRRRLIISYLFFI